ncbi:DivIVA domain-containing protein [Microbacterium sp. OR21]|uniref:DivIVA domain-containing protein n=1 Tax=Microbacterium sp. OR21 TaxID=3095346 RepID=UPI0039B533F1
MTGITAAELADVRIPRRRAGLRYAIGAVDDFLERAAADLRKVESGVAASLSSDDVTFQEFPTVGLFGLGYEADAVDALLDGISAQLNRRGQNAQHGQLRAAQDASDEAKLREMLERIRRGEL